MKVPLEDLRKYIDQIAALFGVREPEPTSPLYKMRPDDIARKIASIFNLPNKLSIIPVKEGNSGPTRFVSKGLTKLDKRGKAAGSIFAQVSIPENMPFFGTEAFSRFVIEVKVSEAALRNNGLFVVVVAHELSHVVLHSIRHPERENEIFTDLTCMGLGFMGAMERWRKSSFVRQDCPFVETETTTTLGYLDDDQFRFSCKAFRDILAARKKMKVEAKKKLFDAHLAFEMAKKELMRTREILAQLQKRPTHEISSNDAWRISELYQSSWVDSCHGKLQSFCESEKILLDALGLLGPTWNLKIEEKARSLHSNALTIEANIQGLLWELKTTNLFLLGNCSKWYIAKSKFRQIGDLLKRIICES